MADVPCGSSGGLTGDLDEGPLRERLEQNSSTGPIEAPLLIAGSVTLGGVYLADLGPGSAPGVGDRQ
jgi:hypothetical protein